MDTIVFHHAARGGKNNVLDTWITKKVLRLAVDPNLAIVDEWKLTVGEDATNVLFTKWAECNGVRIVPVLGQIPPGPGKALRQAGFRGTIDRLLVRIALVTNDRIVVSEDSDFWDPADTSRPGKIGDARAVVAKMLNDSLAVTVLSLPGLLDRLRQNV